MSFVFMQFSLTSAKTGAGVFFARHCSTWQHVVFGSFGSRLTFSQQIHVLEAHWSVGASCCVMHIQTIPRLYIPVGHQV